MNCQHDDRFKHKTSEGMWCAICENEELHNELADVRKHVKSLEQKLMILRAALMTVEPFPLVAQGDDYADCIWCGRSEARGHAKNCEYLLAMEVIGGL